MWDFWRNWRKPAEEKRLEALNAYLDGSLPVRERAALEAELARDEALRAELAQLRLVRERLRQLPRRRAPRNFTLDPALYGRPQRQPLVQAYPVLRMATALTAVFLVLAVALQIALPGSSGAFSAAEQTVAVTLTMSDEVAMEAAAETAEETAAEMTAAAAEMTAAAAEMTAAGAVAPAAAPIVEGEVVEVTRVVSEVLVETVVEADSGTAADTAGMEAVGEQAPEPDVQSFTAAPSPAPTLFPTPDVPRMPSAESGTERAGEMRDGLATAVPPPTPLPEADYPTPLPRFPLLSVGLGILLALLAALTLIARRRLL